MPDTATHDVHALAWYAQRKPQFLGGHEVCLLRGATQLFPALIAAMDQAKSSIWLASYLVSEAGQTLGVIDALCRAAKRGVAVHMVVDGAGSSHVPETIWEKVRRSGVHWAVFRPMGPWWQVMLDTAQWRRMHIKLCVIDEHEAFTGGINMIDDCYDLDHGWSANPRLDYAVRFTGPSVLPALQTARAMWTRASLGHDWREDLAELLRERGRIKRVKQLWQHAKLQLPKDQRAELAEDHGTDEPMQAAFVLRDNLRQRRTIERAAIRAILRSRHKVDIVTPYFYPGLALKRALVFAAKRGVQVRLLLQGKPDFRLAAMAARVLYRELQAQGVRIFEYQAAMLHAKVICIDEAWATVGSSNLDPLSMVMNLEANLIVRDKKFAASLSDQLAFDFTQSREVVSNSTFYRLQHNRITRAIVAGVAKLYLRLAGIAKHY
jgi:cardiolipin synthase A/B